MAQRPRYVAGFDSSTAMLRAVARTLRGAAVPGVGTATGAARVAGWLPGALGDGLWSLTLRRDGIPPRALRRVSSEAVARWLVSSYPRRTFPAVAIGSSNGALVHLCTALGIPWLPQTLAVPVTHRHHDPDDLQGAMRWGAETATPLLEANPDLALHHVHDPDRDRRLVARRALFRVKRLALGATLTGWLEAVLPPGGTLLVFDDALTWPATRVGERHVFQAGAPGGASPEELRRGGVRVERFLARHGAMRTAWDPPPPDGDAPDAEWGFAPELRADVERLAATRSWRVRRLRFGEPEDASDFVATLFHWWYRQRGILPQRLLVESYLLLEPWWALRTGAVPWWSSFPGTRSLARLSTWLDSVPRFDEIHAMLFSHGTESIGLAEPAAWREAMARARRGGRLLGVDESRFPHDIAVLARFHRALTRTVRARWAMPGRLTLAELDRFLAESARGLSLQWHDGPAPRALRGAESAVA